MRRPRNYMLLTDEQIEALPENLQPLAHVVFDRRIIPLLAPMGVGGCGETAAGEYGEDHNWENAFVAWDVLEKQWIIACPDCGSAFTTGFGGDGFGGSSGYGVEECESGEEWDDMTLGFLDRLPRMITTHAERKMVYEIFGVYLPGEDQVGKG